jgi:hypothetical protein
MNAPIGTIASVCNPHLLWSRALLIAGFFIALAPAVQAVGLLPGGGGSSPTYYTPLDSWSFQDSVGWTSDTAHAPISFTNLSYSNLGNGASLVVDSNVPAWLQYNVYENDGTTNLTVDSGTVMFWFAPSSWSGTNQGGTGPGEFGRLLETGGYTPDSSFGWWSIYVDAAGANLYFSAQTNDLSSSMTTYLSAPIAWTTNYFHHVALTYSATNTALYLDGGLVTNGPPMTVYPGANALANGVFFGSDSNGIYQAHGLFNSVATYNVPLDANTIQQTYNRQSPFYKLNPLNKAMFTLTNALSYPSYTGGYEAISGAGILQATGCSSFCTDGANTNQIWLTNITATAAGGGSMNVGFTIEGGVPGVAYDVFATGALEAPLTNAIWVWLGQGYQCTNYLINITSGNAFLILGTRLDSNGDGVSDAYSLLVANMDPNQVQTDGYGVPYAWYVQNGINPNGAALLDPDWDGLLNYQEYQYGTKPTVSEGFSIWAAIGTTSIP